jgi:hypothetical protein
VSLAATGDMSLATTGNMSGVLFITMIFLCLLTPLSQVTTESRIVNNLDLTIRESNREEQQQPSDSSSAEIKSGKSCNREGSCVKTISSAATASLLTTTPCKYIARPDADVTQMPESTCEIVPSVGRTDCAQAYRLLMRYATTEEKLDEIAHALEEGCVLNEEQDGGCKMKNSSIWKALDKLCI